MTLNYHGCKHQTVHFLHQMLTHMCFTVEAVTLLISYRYIDQLAMLYRIVDNIDGLSHV